MNEQLFDVLEFSIATGKPVAVMARNKTERNAEAIVCMAVMRRGVETSYYSTTPAGQYADSEIGAA